MEPGLGEDPVLTSGWVGVDMFFVLSGFLITGILLDSRDHPHRIRNFFARRVLRIFPLYYLVLFLLFVVAPFFTTNPEILYPDSDKPYYVLYVQNLFLPLIEGGDTASLYLSHTWSLAVEEQYYLVWPWLVLFLPRRVLIVLLGLILIAAPIARYLVLSEHPGAWKSYWLVYKHTLLHIDGLAVGSLMAILIRSKRVTTHLVRNLSAVMALITLPYAFWILHKIYAEGGIVHYPFTPTTPWIGASTFSILAIGFGGVLGVTLTQSSKVLDAVLSNPVAVWIGSISYGLYVYHFPVIRALLPYELHPLIAPTLTVAIAALSWYLIEKPILKLKSRFR